jgi:hypothetical protein
MPSIAPSGRVIPEPLTNPVDIDIQHHDHKQEEHHHCANIDKDDGNRQKFSLQQSPDTPAGKKASIKCSAAWTGLRAVITRKLAKMRIADRKKKTKV